MDVLKSHCYYVDDFREFLWPVLRFLYKKCYNFHLAVSILYHQDAMLDQEQY